MFEVRGEVESSQLIKAIYSEERLMHMIRERYDLIKN
jgi:hypothetical protein